MAADTMKHRDPAPAEKRYSILLCCQAPSVWFDATHETDCPATRNDRHDGYLPLVVRGTVCLKVPGTLVYLAQENTPGTLTSRNLYSTKGSWHRACFFRRNLAFMYIALQYFPCPGVQHNISSTTCEHPPQIRPLYGRDGVSKTTGLETPSL